MSAEREKREMEKIIEDIYSLSPTQEGLLFHTLYDSESVMYFEQMSYRLSGDLQMTRFKEAWQQVVDRHQILRTAFYWEEAATPLQVVYRHVELPWEHLDWREMSEDEQEKKLKAYLQEDCRRGFTLSQAPLMRMTLIRLDEDVYQFIWSFHHLLLDGWSVSLLLQEVFEIYDALRQGERARLEPPRPYRDYIAWLEEQGYVGSGSILAQDPAGIYSPDAVRERKVGG